MRQETYQNSILVVDDRADNLRLLSAMLSNQGYLVRKALSGQMALKTIDTLPPDLILLDINMLNMNGYEVCQILKANNKTKDIPIIFISAINDVNDKVRAFKMGGVDYITKPFQAEEVIARIENQLIICRHKRQLEKEIKEKEKAEEALHLYLHAVSHDLRNPVISMSIILNNLKNKSQKDLENIPVPLSLIEQMRESCDRQLHLINSLIETRQNEIWGISLNIKYFSLYELAQKISKEWEWQFKKHEANLINKISDKLPNINGDYYQILRVWENLLANAIKYNSRGVNITLDAELVTADRVCCSVSDDGIGISQEQSKYLFQRYQKAKGGSDGLSLGLGLYLCRQIVNAHGGEIGVESNPYQGSRFWFTLPTN